MSAFLNERSPNRIRWDRHSSLTDRTQRSAKAFQFGAVRRKSQTLHARCCQGSAECRAELGIAIVQQVAAAVEMSHPVQCRVASYLTHPACIRTIRDSGDGDPSAVQVNEK